MVGRYVKDITMKPDPLEQTLASYAKQPLPACPDRLTADVWREIKQRRRHSIWTRLLRQFDWRELSAEPRLAVAAFGLALVIGLLPAILEAKPEVEKRLARESLHFEVFSSRAPLALLANLDPASSHIHQ